MLISVSTSPLSGCCLSLWNVDIQRRLIWIHREAVLREQPKAVFLTSPNNPDGSCIDEEDLLALLDLPVLVVLDEAYQEFTDRPSRITWVPNYPNLVVLRTFSKCAGHFTLLRHFPYLCVGHCHAALAGMRVGYGAFPLDLVSYLWRARQPYNVSVAAEVAACAAISNREYMRVRFPPPLRSSMSERACRKRDSSLWTSDNVSMAN